MQKTSQFELIWEQCKIIYWILNNNKQATSKDILEYNSQVQMKQP